MGYIMTKVNKSDLTAKKELNFPFESGDLVWCNISTRTTLRGNSYFVIDIFAYRNKYSYGFKWDYFITIKNDVGYTVKVNANKFRKRHNSISDKDRLEIRIKELENKVKNLEECLIRL